MGSGAMNTWKKIAAELFAKPKGSLLDQHRDGQQTIHVYQNEQLRWMRFSDQAIQSAMARQQPTRLILPYTETMAGALLFNSKPKKIAILGMGTGSLLRYFHQQLPKCKISSVEKSQIVVDMAHRYFNLPTENHQSRIHVTDAHHFINKKNQLFDMIFVDLHDATVIQPLLLTSDFYQSCYQALNHKGILVVNLLAESAPSFSLALKLIRVMFNKQALCVAVPEYLNVIVLAFKENNVKLNGQNLISQAQHLKTTLPLDFNHFIHQIIITDEPIFANMPLINNHNLDT